MADNNNTHPSDEIMLGEDKEARLRARAKRNLQRANKKNGRFFNAFDLVVIFIVLVALTLLVLGVRVSDIFGASQEGRACRVEYQVLFTAVNEEFAASIKLGDSLYDADTKVGMGRVAAVVQTTPTMTIKEGSSTADGFVGELVPVVGKVDMTVTVVVDAVYVEGVGYTIDARALRIGGARTLRFPGYVGTGTCMALREVNAAG